ncbi:MAG: hypothetical protein NVSMB48_00040 [Marmoricola sp.]
MLLTQLCVVSRRGFGTVGLVGARWRADAPEHSVVLAVGRCLVAVMDSSGWSELGLVTGTYENIQRHPRLLRSLRFGDDDYDGCVYELTPVILGKDKAGGLDRTPQEVFRNLDAVTQFAKVDEWLREHDRKLFDKVFEDADDAALPDGTVLSAAEAAAVRLKVGEMRRQVDRIRRDHEADPEAAVGQAKELVETVCKTILGMTGDSGEEAETVPALVDKALRHLGVHPATLEDNGDQVQAHAMKRMMGGVASVLNGVGELRNKRGTGHGRSGAPVVDDAVARLAVGLVLTSVVYLCELHERALAVELPPFGAVSEPNPDWGAGVPELGDDVSHATFGVGRVVEVVSDLPGHSGRVLKVDFGGEVGAKRLLERYARLRLIR